MRGVPRLATVFLMAGLVVLALAGCTATYPFQGDLSLFLTPVPAEQMSPDAVATAMAVTSDSAQVAAVADDVEPAAEPAPAVEAAAEPAATSGEAGSENAPETAAPAETVSEPAPNAGPSAVVNTRSLRVRLAPTTDSPMIGAVNEGESYPVTGTNQDRSWVGLQIPGLPEIGWVAAEFVSVEAGLEDVPVTSPLGIATVNTDGARLRVRNEPSTEAPIIGYLVEDMMHNVLARSQDGAWLLLEIPDIQGQGWVAAEFVTVTPIP